MAEYLAATGEWDGSITLSRDATRAVDDNMPAIYNEVIGESLGELISEAREAKPRQLRVQPSEELCAMPLRMVVAGPPASGKTSVCQALAKELNLKVSGRLQATA